MINTKAVGPGTKSASSLLKRRARVRKRLPPLEEVVRGSSLHRRGRPRCRCSNPTQRRGRTQQVTVPVDLARRCRTMTLAACPCLAWMGRVRIRARRYRGKAAGENGARYWSNSRWSRVGPAWWWSSVTARSGSGIARACSPSETGASEQVLGELDVELPVLLVSCRFWSTGCRILS